MTEIIDLTDKIYPESNVQSFPYFQQTSVTRLDHSASSHTARNEERFSNNVTINETNRKEDNNINNVSTRTSSSEERYSNNVSMLNSNRKEERPSNNALMHITNREEGKSKSNVSMSSSKRKEEGSSNNASMPDINRKEEKSSNNVLMPDSNREESGSGSAASMPNSSRKEEGSSKIVLMRNTNKKKSKKNVPMDNTNKKEEGRNNNVSTHNTNRKEEGSCNNASMHNTYKEEEGRGNNVSMHRTNRKKEGSCNNASMNNTTKKKSKTKVAISSPKKEENSTNNALVQTTRQEEEFISLSKLKPTNTIESSTNESTTKVQVSHDEFVENNIHASEYPIDLLPNNKSRRRSDKRRRAKRRKKQKKMEEAMNNAMSIESTALFYISKSPDKMCEDKLFSRDTTCTKPCRDKVTTHHNRKKFFTTKYNRTDLTTEKSSSHIPNRPSVMDDYLNVTSTSMNVCGTGSTRPAPTTGNQTHKVQSTVPRPQHHSARAERLHTMANKKFTKQMKKRQRISAINDDKSVKLVHQASMLFTQLNVESSCSNDPNPNDARSNDTTSNDTNPNDTLVTDNHSTLKPAGSNASTKRKRHSALTHQDTTNHTNDKTISCITASKRDNDTSGTLNWAIPQSNKMIQIPSSTLFPRQDTMNHTKDKTIPRITASKTNVSSLPRPMIPQSTKPQTPSDFSPQDATNHITGDTVLRITASKWDNNISSLLQPMIAQPTKAKTPSSTLRPATTNYPNDKSKQQINMKSSSSTPMTVHHHTNSKTIPYITASNRDNHVSGTLHSAIPQPTKSKHESVTPLPSQEDTANNSSNKSIPRTIASKEDKNMSSSSNSVITQQSKSKTESTTPRQDTTNNTSNKSIPRPVTSKRDKNMSSSSDSVITQQTNSITTLEIPSQGATNHIKDKVIPRITANKRDKNMSSLLHSTIPQPTKAKTPPPTEVSVNPHTKVKSKQQSNTKDSSSIPVTVHQHTNNESKQQSYTKDSSSIPVTVHQRTNNESKQQSYTKDSSSIPVTVHQRTNNESKQQSYRKDSSSIPVTVDQRTNNESKQQSYRKASSSIQVTVHQCTHNESKQPDKTLTPSTIPVTVDHHISKKIIPCITASKRDNHVSSIRHYMIPHPNIPSIPSNAPVFGQDTTNHTKDETIPCVATSTSDKNMSSLPHSSNSSPDSVTVFHHTKEQTTPSTRATAGKRDKNVSATPHSVITQPGKAKTSSSTLCADTTNYTEDKFKQQISTKSSSPIPVTVHHHTNHKTIPRITANRQGNYMFGTLRSAIPQPTKSKTESVTPLSIQDTKNNPNDESKQFNILPTPALTPVTVHSHTEDKSKQPNIPPAPALTPVTAHSHTEDESKQPNIPPTSLPTPAPTPSPAPTPTPSATPTPSPTPVTAYPHINNKTIPRITASKRDNHVSSIPHSMIPQQVKTQIPSSFLNKDTTDRTKNESKQKINMKTPSPTPPMTVVKQPNKPPKPSHTPMTVVKQLNKPRIPSHIPMTVVKQLNKPRIPSHTPMTGFRHTVDESEHPNKPPTASTTLVTVPQSTSFTSSLTKVHRKKKPNNNCNSSQHIRNVYRDIVTVLSRLNHDSSNHYNPQGLSLFEIVRHVNDFRREMSNNSNKLNHQHTGNESSASTGKNVSASTSTVNKSLASTVNHPSASIPRMKDESTCDLKQRGKQLGFGGLVVTKINSETVVSATDVSRALYRHLLHDPYLSCHMSDAHPNSSSASTRENKNESDTHTKSQKRRSIKRWIWNNHSSRASFTPSLNKISSVDTNSNYNSTLNVYETKQKHYDNIQNSQNNNGTIQTSMKPEIETKCINSPMADNNPISMNHQSIIRNHTDLKKHQGQPLHTTDTSRTFYDTRDLSPRTDASRTFYRMRDPLPTTDTRTLNKKRGPLHTADTRTLNRKRDASSIFATKSLCKTRDASHTTDTKLSNKRRRHALDTIRNPIFHAPVYVKDGDMSLHYVDIPEIEYHTPQALQDEQESLFNQAANTLAEELARDRKFRRRQNHLRDRHFAQTDSHINTAIFQISDEELQSESYSDIADLILSTAQQIQWMNFSPSTSDQNIREDQKSFAILGLLPNTARSTIRKRFHALARLLHPDKVTANECDTTIDNVEATMAAEAAFKAVREAFEILRRYIENVQPG